MDTQKLIPTIPAGQEKWAAAFLELSERYLQLEKKTQKTQELNRTAYEWSKYAVRTLNAQAHRLELAEEMAAEWSRAPTPDRMATAIEAPMKSFIRSGQRQIVARMEAPIPNPVKPISGPSHLDGMEITTT
jgi:hypothetical protein